MRAFFIPLAIFFLYSFHVNLANPFPQIVQGLEAFRAQVINEEQGDLSFLSTWLKIEQLDLSSEQREDLIHALRNIDCVSEEMKVKLYQNFSQKDIEVVQTQGDLIDLFGEGVLDTQYPFKIKASASTLQEMASMNIQEGDRIAEIGAGTGTFSFILALAYPRLELSLNELNPFSTNYYQDKFQRNQALFDGVQYQFVQGQIDDTQLEYQTFDKIIIRNSFHHFPKPKQMLQSIKKSMHSETQLFITERPASLENRTEFCRKLMYSSKLKRLVKKSGMQLIQEEKVGKYILYGFKLK